MIELIAFIVVTLVFMYISRSSLLAFKSHGFYRFFAWESILGVAAINARVWFGLGPSLVLQIISGFLLVISIFLLIHGLTLLSIIGKPDNKRNEKELLGFEKTSSLVTIGAYKFIRHPMYTSLLLLAWGVYFKNPTIPGTMCAIAATVFLTLTGKADEAECIKYFGDAYKAYMKQTKRFIPFVF